MIYISFYRLVVSTWAIGVTVTFLNSILNYKGGYKNTPPSILKIVTILVDVSTAPQNLLNISGMGFLNCIYFLYMLELL